MTVADYFASNRDMHGRAWIANHCWIEQAVGCFRLNMPGGEVPLLGTDDLMKAASLASQAVLVQDDDADATASVEHGEARSADESERASDTESGHTEDIELEIAEDECADQFDEFRGDGAWPGPSADDAEPGDFEESISDLIDDE